MRSAWMIIGALVLAACSEDTPNVCGDGVVAGAEACDDGNDVDGDSCTNACTPGTCGDSIVWAGIEACDDGNADDNDGCTRSCAATSCGNGHIEANEQCDDGNTTDDDSCRNNCMMATCGDGVVQAANNETCDDGNAVDTDACRANCVAARCGDGAVQAGVEECDDGNADPSDGCLATCVTATCGDGQVADGVEACDDGNDDDTDACTNACAPASCGDGFTQAVNGEQCDDGNAVDNDACRNNCLAARCGDGIVQPGEACDDANAVDTDLCRNTCVAAICGDGVIVTGVEACDDGNQVNTDSCSNACIQARCGDSIVQPVLGEECDDGGTASGDGCTPQCKISTCGDGVLDDDEGCEDGNLVNGDGCEEDCQITPPEVLYYAFDGTGISVPNLASAPPVGTTTAVIFGAKSQGGTGVCGGALLGSDNSSSSDYVNTNWATNLDGTSWTVSFWTQGIPPSATLFYMFGDINAGSFRCFTNGVAGPNNWLLRGTMTDTYANGAATTARTMTTFVYDIALNQIRSYVNGVLVSTVGQAGVSVFGSGPFKVGGYSTNVGLPSGATMDEFRIYSHALTDQQVADLYAWTPRCGGN